MFIWCLRSFINMCPMTSTDVGWMFPGGILHRKDDVCKKEVSELLMLLLFDEMTTWRDWCNFTFIATQFCSLSLINYSKEKYLTLHFTIDDWKKDFVGGGDAMPEYIWPLYSQLSSKFFEMYVVRSVLICLQIRTDQLVKAFVCLIYIYIYIYIYLYIYMFIYIYICFVFRSSGQEASHSALLSLPACLINR